MNNVNLIKDLPTDLKAQYITYLSFGEVQNLCRVDKEMLDFCQGVTPKAREVWRRLITNTFSSVPDLEDVISDKFNCEGEQCWNYMTYTNLVTYLTPVTQARIYIRTNDLSSLNTFSQDIINIAAAFEAKPDLLKSKPKSGTGMFAVAVTSISYNIARKMLGLDTLLDKISLKSSLKYPELVQYVLETDRSITKQEILTSLTLAKRMSIENINNKAQIRAKEATIRLLKDYLKQ